MSTKIKKRNKASGKMEKAGTVKPVYKYIAVIAVIGIVLILLLSNLFSGNNEEEYYMFKKEGELSFYSSDNKLITKIDIELASTEYERQLGLMKRKEMGENQGMLFIFPDETMRSFWMRNTLISLDMIFISADKEIVTIHKNTRKLSDQSYPSSKPAKYVVEVDAGFSEKHNLKDGDKISWIDINLNY